MNWLINQLINQLIDTPLPFPIYLKPKKPFPQGNRVELLLAEQENYDNPTLLLRH